MRLTRRWIDENFALILIICVVMALVVFIASYYLERRLWEQYRAEQRCHVSQKHVDATGSRVQWTCADGSTHWRRGT